MSPDVYLLGKRQAAKFLGVSPGTVERLMRAGLPYIKLGDGRMAGVRFAIRDLADFVSARRVQRTSDAQYR
jgi:hypothetical protein